MTYIRLTNANVHVPLYDSHALRLIRLPSFRRAKVGSSTVNWSGGMVSIHALKNVDLNLSDGDRVCIIGHNGAGKTTLLRTIAGIYPTTSGRLEISGKAFALLGASLIFNPDATGYENINLLAKLYDWPGECAAEYARNIEEFTELGEYLSLPIRIYSAGMQARLAFALATLQPTDILLIDEGIAALDSDFQDKSEGRILQLIGRTKILLMASHSLELCRSLCNKAVLMSKGEAIYLGKVEDAFARYGQVS